MACCVNITEQDTVFANYYENVYDHISNLICNAENQETYGKDTTHTYDMMNDVYYMFTYGWLAKQSQDKKIKAASLKLTVTNPCVDEADIRKEIWKEYNFECMRDYWYCKHDIDLQKILQPFGLNNGYAIGIDYMRIENTDPCVPPFKIV